MRKVIPGHDDLDTENPQSVDRQENPRLHRSWEETNREDSSHSPPITLNDGAGGEDADNTDPVTREMVASRVVVGLLFLAAAALLVIVLFVPALQTAQNYASFSREQDSTGAYEQINNSNIFWYIQATDLHLSALDASKKRVFSEFCRDVVRRIVRPKFVLATGDIADAKLGYGVCLSGFCISRGGMQESEYEDYRRILQENGLFNRTFWLDVRGNHDTYGTSYARHGPGINTTEGKNFFDNYAVTGASSAASQDKIYSISSFESLEWKGYRGPNEAYMSAAAIVYESPFGKYFVGTVDFTPLVGVPSPLNFYGINSKAATESLQILLEDIGNNTFNHTVLSSHYPLTNIVSDGSLSHPLAVLESFNSNYLSRRSATSRGGVASYFCGHYHTEKTYVSRRSGLLELEADDMKTDVSYRIVAIDNDMMSIMPATVGTYPIGAITYPKDATYLTPIEPFERLRRPRVIRAIAFSDDPLVNVTARVWLNRPQSFESEGFLTEIVLLQSSEVHSLYEGTLPLAVAASLEDRRAYFIGLHIVDSEAKNFSHIQRSSSAGEAVTENNLSSLWVSLDFVALVRGVLGLSFICCAGCCLVLPLCFIGIVRRRQGADGLVALAREVDTFYGQRLISGSQPKDIRKLLRLELVGILFRYGRMPLWISIFLIVVAFFLAVGPIAAGPVVNGHWAVVFSWGTWVEVRGPGVPDGRFATVIPFQLPAILIALWYWAVLLPTVYSLSLAFSRRGVRQAYKRMLRLNNLSKDQLPSGNEFGTGVSSNIFFRMNTFQSSPLILRTSSLVISCGIAFLITVFFVFILMFMLLLYGVTTLFVSPISYLSVGLICLQLFGLMSGERLYVQKV